MKVDWAMLARSVTVAEGEFNILGGGLRILKLESFPASMQLALAARLVASFDETGDHVIRLHAFSEEDETKPVMEFEGVNFTIPAPPEVVEIPEIVLAIGATLHINIADPGDYRFDLALDGEVVASMPLRARLEDDDDVSRLRASTRPV